MAKLRLFFAFDLDDEFKEKLYKYQKSLDTDTFRPLKKENLHITLAFLGDIEEERISALSDILFYLDFPDKIILTAKKTIFFPSYKRPSAVAIEVGNPDKNIYIMEKALRKELAIDGFIVDGRKYRPHITVAYIRRGTAVSSDMKIPDFSHSGRFSPVSVSLISSQLAKGGSIFTTLCSRKFN
ncbi:RNA 2',3'-cyclic phosphodiesterase [Spirochaetia bacterium 38H-sp]|uniref:RNA 2',3'-cyclic phosphodiesterase n=1 Tax=Rarispira pelagica TaxID=3141764 RepID=A0ABU9UA12_9SPIR